MKNFIKNNWLIIIFTIIIFGYLFYNCNQYVKNENIGIAETKKVKEKCENEWKDTEDKSIIEYCQIVKNSANVQIDFYTKMTNMIVTRVRLLNPLAFIILIIPTLVGVCKKLKNKYIINCVPRESKRDIFIDFFKTSYKYIWLLPLVALVLILFCAFNTTFIPKFGLENSTSIWSSSIVYKPFLFIILYILNIFIYSIVYINIGLIAARKIHNYIGVIIISILIYLGMDLFFEVIVNGIILNMLFKVDYSSLLLTINLFTFNDTYGIPLLLTFSTFLLIITSIIVYFSYKNFEKLVIDCEKNN